MPLIPFVPFVPFVPSLMLTVVVPFLSVTVSVETVPAFELPKAEEIPAPKDVVPDLDDTVIEISIRLVISLITMTFIVEAHIITDNTVNLDSLNDPVPVLF